VSERLLSGEAHDDKIHAAKKADENNFLLNPVRFNFKAPFQLTVN
jgi:hypothetical protein